MQVQTNCSACALFLALVAGGCDSADVPARAKQFAVPTVSLPEGVLVYQPQFFWSDGTTTEQGTGFIVRSDEGEVVGVSSSHLVDADGPNLVKARWLDMVTGDTVAEFSRSFGYPGKDFTLEPLKLRTDYLLVFEKDQTLELPSLEFDDRVNLEVGERVWLPNKDHRTKPGHTFVEGSIVKAESDFVSVELDNQIQTQSQSGSPLISQKTGKVIGVFSATPVKQNGLIIHCAPARAILEAMRGSLARPLLEDVTGKSNPSRPVGRTKSAP